MLTLRSHFINSCHQWHSQELERYKHVGNIHLLTCSVNMKSSMHGTVIFGFKNVIILDEALCVIKGSEQLLTWTICLWTKFLSSCVAKMLPKSYRTIFSSLTTKNTPIYHRHWLMTIVYQGMQGKYDNEWNRFCI